MGISRLKTIFSDLLTQITGWFTGPLLVILFSVLLVVIVLLAILNRNRRNQIKRLKHQIEWVDQLLDSLQPSKGMEKNLNDLLGFLCQMIQAHSFAFYVLDTKNHQYVLKTVRTQDVGYENISPSYSGLLPYKKETYLPPLSLPVESFTDKTVKVREGAVPLLNVPIKGEKGLVRIGPVGKVTPNTIQTLNIMGKKLQPVLDIIMETEIMKNQVEVIVTSGKAMQSISNMIMDHEGIMSTVVGISIKTIGAAGGFFIQYSNSSFEITGITGLDNNIIQLLKEDMAFHHKIFQLIGRNDQLFIKKGQQEFFTLPPYLVAGGMELFLLVGVSSDNGQGVAVFWYPNVYGLDDIKEYRLTALKVLAGRMGDILTNQHRLKSLSDSYIEMLRMLAQMLDNLSPYSVGYSELMSRYCMIIAKEMGLSAQEIKDIALAAYLSNIGVLGLSDDLFNKKGKYTELEYEIMKLHSDVGASIIEATLGKSNVASYIRYHHERMDGYGYPQGLRGVEIPVGARIIAVVQTFLAKINGRKDREPLSFEKALDLLESASGTQLDSQIVNVLINWFSRKQEKLVRSGRSLGPCWEMRCAPESVCGACPAYQNTVKNCWEYPEDNCTAHGNRCESCFVYTEYLYRKSLQDRV